MWKHTTEQEVFAIYDAYLAGISIAKLGIKFHKSHNAISCTLHGRYHKEYYSHYAELYPDRFTALLIKLA